MIRTVLSHSRAQIPRTIHNIGLAQKQRLNDFVNFQHIVFEISILNADDGTGGRGQSRANGGALSSVGIMVNQYGRRLKVKTLQQMA